MVDFQDVVNNLLEYYPYALAVAIVDASGQIVYSTDNWDISGDLSRLLSSWRGGNAQFVMIQGVKYSMLQMTQERLIATNFAKKGHLVGAATPDGQYKVIAYISPEDEAWHHNAYPSIARAAAMLSGGSSINEASTIEATGGGGAGVGAGAGAAAIDPNLKAQIEEFLNWIKDPQGLAYGIEYYLNQNDWDKIQKLAAVYNEFRRVFNF
ncbi:MAG: hypothetical protein ACTSU2_07735 [Promethearchaeota archaeon]